MLVIDSRAKRVLETQQNHADDKMDQLERSAKEAKEAANELETKLTEVCVKKLH